MISLPKQTAPPKIQRISINDWLKGSVTAFSDGRTPTSGLVKSDNSLLYQDGTVGPRPGLIRYGTQPVGTVLGEMFEFTDTSTGVQVNSLITMQNVSGTTNIYTSTDGEAWVIDAGGSPVSFNDTAEAHYCQVDDKVLIMNAVDPLAYYDIPTGTVIEFTALSTPTIPSLVATGLTGSTYTYYYKITANSTVGETDSSPEASQAVGTLRDQWIPASQYITLTWSAVASARSYNVYIGTVAGDEFLLASGITGLSFKDDGSVTRDVSRKAPVADTTQGPIMKNATVINGQTFGIDAVDPFMIRSSGVGTSALDFSPFGGGGTTDIGKGTKELPVRVVAYRTGKGDAVITVLCKGTNGTGKRYIMTPDSITQGTTFISFFDVTEDNGQTGTDSPYGVVLYRDNIWYPSTDGFKTTGTKPQLQNVLSTDTISETIIDSIPTLNSAAMDKAIGLANQDRIYWALPVSSNSNNQIWVLDLARGGAWMKPWAIAVDQMSLYNDSSGVTHHLVLSDNIIYEFSAAHPTQDDGIGFPTDLGSGLYKFSPDSLEWAKVIDVTFILLKPQGSITFSVSGMGEDGPITVDPQNEVFDQTSSVAGWGEAGWGGSPTMPSPGLPEIFGWSDFSEVPEIVGDAQDPVVVDVDEELQWIQWEMVTTAGGANYQLSDVIVRYVDIGTKDLG